MGPNLKSGKSAGKNEAHSAATTIGEYRRPHPIPGWLINAGLVNDTKSGLIFFRDRALANRLRDSGGLSRVLLAGAGPEDAAPAPDGAFMSSKPGPGLSDAHEEVGAADIQGPESRAQAHGDAGEEPNDFARDGRRGRATNTTHFPFTSAI